MSPPPLSFRGTALPLQAAPTRFIAEAGDKGLK
jgi:hypothetical protein